MQLSKITVISQKNAKLNSFRDKRFYHPYLSQR